MIYAPDTRYKVAFGPERREFNLVIRAVTQNDAGVYECQVSSRDKLLRHVLLWIEEILLSGKGYVGSGDTIRLVCNITGNTNSLQDADWFRNGHIIFNEIIISKETSMAQAYAMKTGMHWSLLSAITMENVRILDREPSWFERGVKEAINIRALRPALNKDGGHYQLSHTWDHTLTSLTPTISGVNVS
ncbi:uncharacterized protein LOC127878720 [Dreissena polymorpha]|nr:uncharacterized protein LOC127878720 [Dreissena polymorpha]